MGVSFSRSKPIGSVHKPRTIHVADLPPLNSDHVGGMKVAAATFAGIEHKFGLKVIISQKSNYFKISSTFRLLILPLLLKRKKSSL